MSMSGVVVLSTILIVFRKFPLVFFEIFIRIADQTYRLCSSFNEKIENDFAMLKAYGFEDVSWPHHHCWRNGQIEFYTTTFRIGAGSFIGWRCRITYLPDVYVECAFGDLWNLSPVKVVAELTERIKGDVAFLQMAQRESERISLR